MYGTWIRMYHDVCIQRSKHIPTHWTSCIVPFVWIKPFGDTLPMKYMPTFTPSYYIVRIDEISEIWNKLIKYFDMWERLLQFINISSLHYLQGGQSSPGNFIFGGQPLNGDPQIPQSSSFTGHFHSATAVHFLTVTFKRVELLLMLLEVFVVEESIFLAWKQNLHLFSGDFFFSSKIV